MNWPEDKATTQYGSTVDNELTVLWEMQCKQKVHLLDASVLQVARPKGTAHMLCRTYQLLEHAQD